MLVFSITSHQPFYHYGYGRITVQVTDASAVVTVRVRPAVLSLVRYRVLRQVLLAGMVTGASSDMTPFVTRGYVIVGAPLAAAGAG